MTVFEKDPGRRQSCFRRGDPVVIGASDFGVSKALRFGFALKNTDELGDSIGVYTHFGISMANVRTLKHFDGEVDLSNFPYERFIPDRLTVLPDGTKTLWSGRGAPIISVNDGHFIAPDPRELVEKAKRLEEMPGGIWRLGAPENVIRGRRLRNDFHLYSREWPGFEASFELYLRWNSVDQSLSGLVRGADDEKSSAEERDRYWRKALEAARGSEIGLFQ